MTAIYDQAIDHPSAWKGADLAGKEAVAVDLGPRRIDALRRALDAVKARGLGVGDFGRQDFDLALIVDDLARIRTEVLDGRGLVILRGFPVDRHDADDMALMFWGLGCHFGRAVSQSRLGDRLGHVTDVSGKDPRERGYRSRKELRLHTDADNIVGLLCLKGARSGGLSRFASALAVHNELHANARHHLGSLYRGFRYHWRGEQPPGEPPITAYRVPVLSARDGVVSCVYLRDFVEMAADDLGQPLTAAEEAALDAFEDTANRPDMVFECQLEPGEAALFNNLALLHARTEFKDFVAPARNRHLLRLWLKVANGRPLADAVRRYYGADGIVPAANVIDTLYESRPAR